MMDKIFCTDLSKKQNLKKTLLIKRSEKGQGMVELAISLIIILIILAGLVDLSRTIITKMSLQDAAEEGIVYASVFPKDCTQIQYRIMSNLAKVKTAKTITIQYDLNSDGTVETLCSAVGGTDVTKGKLMKITITTNFKVSMPFLGTAIGSNRNVTVDAKGIVLK
jgi:Flp pilus assembly protein TadG